MSGSSTQSDDAEAPAWGLPQLREYTLINNFDQKPMTKINLGARKPIARGPAFRDKDEEKALIHLVKKLKEHPDDLWPLPPKMVIAGDVDATLIRFLRARKCKVDDSFEMLKNTILWRRAENVELALETSPGPRGTGPLAAIREGISSAYVGNDNEGVPVYVEQTGMLEMNSVLAKGTTVEELVRLHVVSMEYFTNVLCLEGSIATGRTVDKVVTVMDLADVSITNARNKHFLKLFKAMTAIDQNNYPEVMKTVYIVNAPWIFSSIFALIKGFLDPATQKKIQVLTPKKAREALAESVNLNDIPKVVGGNASNDLLSTPDGRISYPHYKQDFYIDSFRAGYEELADEVVGPNCFSQYLGDGVPLYKMMHHSDYPLSPTAGDTAPPAVNAQAPFMISNSSFSIRDPDEAGPVLDDDMHTCLTTLRDEDIDPDVSQALVTIEKALARARELKASHQDHGDGHIVPRERRDSAELERVLERRRSLEHERHATKTSDPVEFNELDHIPENDHVQAGCCFCFGGGKKKPKSRPRAAKQQGAVTWGTSTQV